MPKNSKKPGMSTSARDFKAFSASLDEAVKFAKGKKAKVTVERLLLRVAKPAALGASSKPKQLL